MSDNNEDREVPPFGEYNWENDEGWQILVKKLEFPGQIDESKKQKILLKKKKIYYKSIGGVIDESTMNSNSNSNNNISSDDVKQDIRQDINDDSSNNTGNNKSNVDNNKQNDNSSYNNNDRKDTKKKKRKKRVNRPSFVQQMFNFFYLFSNWSVLIFGIASAVIKPLYKYSLYIAALMYLVNILQTHGKPQFNMQFFQNLMQNATTMMFINALILLMGPPIFIFLSPLLLRCFYMGCYLMKGTIDMYFNSISLVNNYSKKLKKVVQSQGWYLRQVALLEVIVGIILIPCIILVRRVILLTIIYWQIMQAKYMMDPNIRSGFTTVNAKITSYTVKVPFIHKYYIKLTGLLSDMVDPNKLRQKYEQTQQNGASSSMMGNMMKKCVIM